MVTGLNGRGETEEANDVTPIPAYLVLDRGLAFGKAKKNGDRTKCRDVASK
jgi:hypothetical protein